MKTQPRIERKRKPAACPACGHRPVASILYGEPGIDPELAKAIKGGRITLGGCCVTEDDAAWECTECGQTIYRKKS